MLLAHTSCNFAKTPPWCYAQAGPPLTPQPPPATPGSTRDLTTLWSVPASSHSFTAAASLPQLKTQTTAPSSWNSTFPSRLQPHLPHMLFTQAHLSPGGFGTQPSSQLTPTACSLQHATSFYSTASRRVQRTSSTKLTTSSRQLGPQHTAQQASVKISQHPATATPHSTSAQPTGTKNAAPYIVSGVEQKGATQVHPPPLPF